MSETPKPTTVPLRWMGTPRTEAQHSPLQLSPQFARALPLALYIHIPWCVRKCPYCDFNSHVVREGAAQANNDAIGKARVQPPSQPHTGPHALPEDEYVAALIADLEAALPNIWGRRISSIFFGGGTPSLFSAQAIEQILTAVRMRTNLQPDAEITLEANPGTVEAARFAGYRDAGVTRVSLGIQSFNDRHLAALGRIHSASEAQRAIELAQQHFAEVNLDIMYALPEQSLNEALHDVDRAIACGTTHLSCYHLTLEPNTPFAAHPPAVPDDDVAADMQLAIEQRLQAAGYEHYETSAFAKAGHRCKHNLNYWQFGDYLGIGAGAHSKLSFHDRVQREMRHKHPTAYLQAVQQGTTHGATQGAHIQTTEVVSGDALPFEFMMNALRLCDGFPLDLFEERTGLPLRVVQPLLKQAEQRGLLALSANAAKPTEQGRRFLNELLQIFLVE